MLFKDSVYKLCLLSWFASLLSEAANDEFKLDNRD